MGFKFNCPSLRDSEVGGAMKPSGYSRRRRRDMIRSAYTTFKIEFYFFFSLSLMIHFFHFSLSHWSHLWRRKKRGRNGRARLLLFGSLPLWRRSRNESYLQSIIQPVITEKSIALPKSVVSLLFFFFDLSALRNTIRDNIRWAAHLLAISSEMIHSFPLENKFLIFVWWRGRQKCQWPSSYYSHVSHIALLCDIPLCNWNLWNVNAYLCACVFSWQNPGCAYRHRGREKLKSQSQLRSYGVDSGWVYTRNHFAL